MFSLQRAIPQCSARQSLLSLSKRFLATEVTATTPTAFQRTVLVNDIPSPAELSNFLDKHVHGPIEHIKYDPKSKSATLRLISPGYASAFKKSYPNATYGEEVPIPADVVASIGYKNATRCIVMNPTPEGATVESLTEELSKFGPLERVEIQPSSKEGITFARVHFYSIADAIKALDSQQVAAGTKIHFGIDRLDSRMNRLKSKKDKKEQPLESNIVVITGLKSKPTHKRVNWLVRNAIVQGRDPVSLVNILDNGTVFINFFHKSHASLFVKAVNSGIPTPVEGGGKFQLREQKRFPVTELNRRVRDLGADRTMYLELTPRADRTKLLDRFSTYGKVIDVQISDVTRPDGKKIRAGFITYANIVDSLKAMSLGSRSHRVGSLVDEMGFASNFATRVKPPKSEKPKANDSAPASEDKTAEV